jgi:hypothetical protein
MCVFYIDRAFPLFTRGQLLMESIHPSSTSAADSPIRIYCAVLDRHIPARSKRRENKKFLKKEKKLK